MKKTFTILIAAIAAILMMAQPGKVWASTDQVTSQTATNNGEYVIAIYYNGDYYALPGASTITASNTYSGTKLTLNALGKVNTSDAAGITWKLVEGTTSGQFKIQQTINNTTKYLIKSGTTGNTNYKINTSTTAEFWEFTQQSNTYLTYSVKSLKSGATVNLYLTNSSSTFGAYGSTNSYITLLAVGDAQAFTVTLADDNSTLPEASAGAGVTLPSRSDVSPYTFAGWSSISCGSQETTNAPASIIPAGTYHPTANVTLHPVYKRVDSSSSTTTWNLTALADADEGVYALLTPDGHAFNGSISSGHGGTTTNAFSFTNGVATQAPSGVCEITFTAVKNNNNVVLGYTMYNSGTDRGYLYATKASSGGLAWHNSESDYWYHTTITDVENWEYSKEYNSNKARLRTYNNSSFRTYNANSNDDLKLAKKVTSYTTYYISVVSTGTPTIVASNVGIEYNAQSGSIEYSINEEPDPAGTLTAAIKEGTTSTITNLTFGTITNDEVPFTCSANNELLAHTATVTLTYTYGNNETVTKDVTITQDAHPTPSITAENVNINYNSTGGNIAYTINDGIEGGSVSASVPNNSWITLPNTFDSPIEFTCEDTEGVVARTETVTLTYTYNTNQTVTKEVTVTQGVDATLGTSANPYTVAQARTFIDGLNGATSADGKHVSGIISQVDSYSSQYKSITYWISDDGTTTDQLQVYSGKGINGADFSSINDLKTSDRVVVKGKLKYHNNTTYEFDYNNQLVSLDRDASITVANTNIEVNAIAGQSTINVTYNNFGTETILADVTYYEADGETVVTNPETVYPWFVAVIYDDNNVECTYEEHTGNTARPAYFRVWAYYDDNMNNNEIVYSDLITFTQRTPAQTQYPITKTATLAGTISVTDANNVALTEALPQTEVYLTFEAADCQTFNSWTVSNTSTNPATSVTVTDGHFTMPAGAVTVTANTTASPVLDYLYVVNGVNGEDQSTCTSPLTLPTTVVTPRGFRFVGWTTDENDVDNIITSYSFDANETVFFYAVFAHLEGGVYTYQRITSNTNLSDGNYLIVYESENGSKIQDAGNYDIDALPNNLDVTINEGNVINGTSAINNATFTIAAFGETENNYSVLSTSGKYMGQTSNANGMVQNTTWNDNLANTITFDGNNCNIVGSGGAYLRYNSASNQQRFRYYKTSSYTGQQAIQLYKQTVVEAGTTAYYTRVIDTNPTGDIEITTTTIIAGGAILNMGDHSIINNDPTKLIIEDGAQLILANTNTNVKATVQKSIKAAGAQSSKVGEAPFGWYSISSSVNNASLKDNTNLITQDETPYKFDLYRYNETVSAEQWENYHANNDFTHMTNGRGYLYRNAEDLIIEFTGTVNTGEIVYHVTYTDASGDLAGFNLIGNPYTHDIYKGAGTAIDNANLNEGFYVATNSGSWLPCTDNDTKIEKNQGILVQASESFDLTMTNTDAKTSSSKANHDNIKFMVSNSQYEDVAYAMFDKGNGLNKISHRNAEIPMLYIPQNDENYAIAMMSDDTQSFGLNFKAMTMGKYTLSYKADGQFSYLHVIDRLTGEDVDMLLEESYSFVGTPKDAENRFIVKLNYQSGLDSSDNSTFAYQSGNDIIVSGEGTLQIFDVMGRMIATQNINGVETVNVPANGVYVFRLNEKVQKVVVK